MIRLIEPARLVWPAPEVRVSYLVGEQADCLLRGTPTQWLEAASEDWAGFVAARRGVQVRWGVPSTVFWYVSGEYYLGTLVVRHQLTRELAWPTAACRTARQPAKTGSGLTWTATATRSPSARQAVQIRHVCASQSNMAEPSSPGPNEGGYARFISVIVRR